VKLPRKRPEDGFTVVELLVVLVIMPLIVGAIAVAIITTEKNAGTTKSRLIDSANAQITSEYFVPDIQAAQFATTVAVSQPFSATAPQVCGDGTGTKLLLGLYRPVSLASPYLSVGYWLTNVNGSASVVRYACSLNTTGTPPPYNATIKSTVVISDDINPAVQGLASIAPSQFSTAAAAGWTPVTASTSVATTTAIPTSGTWSPPCPVTTPQTPEGCLPVTSTSGFDLSQPIIVTTSNGFQSIKCTGPTLPNSNVAGPSTMFTGCASISHTASTAGAGFAVSQPASMSAINLSVFEPGSAYNYQLAGSPRSYGALGGSGSGGPGVGAPALLTLGGPDSITGGANAILHVNGNVNINNGSLGCTGGPYVYAFGFGATSGPSAYTPSTCATGGPTTTQPAIPDPYAKILPTYGSPQFPYQPRVNSIPNGGACTPGEYTVAFNNCTTLQPGVYVLDQGFNTQGVGGTPITMASGTPPNQGVLLYLPCNPPGAPTTCNEQFQMSGGQSLTIPGLGVGQSAQLFGTTALQGLVLWQEGRGTGGNQCVPTGQGDTCGARIGGTSNSLTLTGTLYFPTAGVTIQGGGNGTNISTGRIIAKSLTMAGSASSTITPK
jgi:hypothetical protein